MKHSPFRHLLLGFFLLCAAPAAIAENGTPPTIDLSAEGSAQAANDLARATMYFEASEADPAGLARKVNRRVAEALEKAQSAEGIRAKSAGMNTYPVYSRNGEPEIKAWRMRAAIQLESQDLPALSELIGELQQTLSIGELTLEPTREGRNTAADEAAMAALRAFEQRAQTLAAALGKDYQIRHLNIDYGHSRPPVRPMARSAALTAEAAPAPIEAGESELTVTINGTIGLVDDE